MAERGKLLAVAREAERRALYGELLEGDYHLRIVDRGEACLAVAAEYRPDVILLDMPLAGGEGTDLCRRLRRDAATRRARIMILPPEGGGRVPERAREAGADDCMVRPFEEEELLSRIGVHLRIRRAEIRDRLVTKLLSAVGQETRKALGSFMGIAELLESNATFTEEELKSYGTVLEESADDLRDLLERTRTLHALKIGRLQFDREPHPIRDLVKSAIQEISPLSRRRKITLQERHSADPVVTVDRRMMKRAILFLLKNAVHFSRGSGVITVSVSMPGEAVRIAVADQGAGIEPDLLPHIFDAFQDRDEEGGGGRYGISLAMARQIVREHSGSIQVESRPGSGSTFTVVLPANPGGGPGRASRSAWRPEEPERSPLRRSRAPLPEGGREMPRGESNHRTARGTDWPGKCRPKGAGRG